MNFSAQIFNAVESGCKTYEDLLKALPNLDKYQIQWHTSHLKQSGYLIKQGRGNLANFRINPSKPYVAVFNTISSVEKVESTPTTNGVGESQPTVAPVTLTMPDFNQMFLDLVETLADEIVSTAMSVAKQTLNTPELANELSQELLSRFSLPVVLYAGPTTSTLTFPNHPQVDGTSIAHVPGTLNIPEAFVKEHPEAIVKVDPTLMQAPKEPEPVKVRTRLPRVCVTGMKPIEAGAISKEFAETFDLLFWNDRNGDGVEQLKAYSKSCEALFWHVKHGSHSDESIARDGTAKFYRVNGDLSQMRKKLREYFQELKTANAITTH